MLKPGSGVRERVNFKRRQSANSGSWRARDSLKVDGSFCRDTYSGGRYGRADKLCIELKIHLIAR